MKTAIALLFLAGVTTELANFPRTPTGIRGVAVGLGGVGLSDVQVDLWNGSGHIATVRTAADGDFFFTPENVAQAVRLQARRVGYRSLSRPLFPGDSVLRLEMEPIQSPLPTVVVAAARRTCPNRSDPEANDLWDAARRHYSTGVAGKGIARQSRSWAGSVPDNMVGTVEQSRLRGFWSTTLGVPHKALVHRLKGEGYATRLPYDRPGYQAVGNDQHFMAWRYAKLEGREAYHFAEAAFGEMNTMSVISAGPGGFTIGFCPRRKFGTTIEGTLELAGDTSFLSAAWRFRTPNPDEDAGGEVLFLPPDKASPSFLLPSSGIFWRRMNRSSRYWQTAETYLRWVVGADSTMPAIVPGDR